MTTLFYKGLEKTKVGLKIAGAAVLSVPLGVMKYEIDRGYFERKIDTAHYFDNADEIIAEAVDGMRTMDPLSTYICEVFRTLRDQ